MNVIQTVNLTKSYGKARGIIDLNLSVEQGEFFGFIGPNGAGKSTTIRTLLGLIQATSGSAKIFEKDICIHKTELLQKIGYLPSEAVFYSGMKVSEVLKLSANLRKTNCKEETSRLCERLALDSSRKVDELSFGNRKKVGIICALQHRPELLILDEPTSGLDPLMQREFFLLLHELHKEGTTIFLSSHILSEIQKNCKRAAIIREGMLIACNDIEHLSDTSAKRVVIHGDYKPEILPEARNITRTDETVSFLYSGTPDLLIQSLGGSHVLDITITEPDLEEIVMHYYTDGGNSK